MSGSRNWPDATSYLSGVEITPYSVPLALMDGAAPTPNAYSRYQWALRQLLEGENYSSLFSDAPRDVKVAVIDEWPGHNGHPDLVNKYETGINTIEGGTNTTTVWDGTAGGNLHGQTVASIIAAEHKSTGMAGAFHRARIIPVRASLDSLPCAILSAAAAGAEVISIAGYATGGEFDRGFYPFPDSYEPLYYPSLFDEPARAYYVPKMLAVRSAIEYVTGNGVVVISVIANKCGKISTNFVSCCKETITAGATNILGEISPHNSTSFNFDVFAPGGDRRPLTTTINLPADILAPDASANADDPLVAIGPNKYSFLTLGSASGPHVAAAAAIVKSYAPSMSPDSVRRILRASTNPPKPNLVLNQFCGGVLSLKKLRALL